MKKYDVGYTQGVFDMFHIGHLNLLLNAKKMCKHLIVGVNSDKLVSEYKNKIPIIKESDRRSIIDNIKPVDESFIATTLDKIAIWNNIHFNAIFIGDDWKGNPRWENTQTELSKIGVDVVFIPYTNGICSTDLRSYESERITGE